MKWLLYLLITVAVVTGITLLAIADRGYVLINIWHYTIESTVVTWIIVLGIVFTLLHYTIRVTGNFLRMPRDMRKWREQRRQQSANKALLEGMVKLAEGNWKAAEKQVLKHSSDSQVPMLNYIAAARAAHELHANERRDQYLKMASQHAGDTDISVKLTQAELHMNRDQQEQALASLRVLQQANPQHRAVLKALSQLYRDIGDWESLIALFPQLKKQKVYNSEILHDLEKKSYLHLLASSAITQQGQLDVLWRRIPTNIQQEPDVIVAYTHQLLRFQQSEVAEPLIRSALKREWNDGLVRLYGLLEYSNSTELLRRAEEWLQGRENNSALLLTLGRLCLRNQLWGKARSYLEASIGAGVGPEGFNELAHLLDKMGEKELAVKYYREGLARAPHCQQSVVDSVKIQEEATQNSGYSAITASK